MKLFQWITAAAVTAGCLWNAMPAQAADEEGVAIAIVYDTSGSMAEPAKDASGKSIAKYRIANNALAAIARRIESFATNTAAGPRKVYAGLFTFKGNGADASIPMAPFDAARISNWSASFAQPAGGTPLGTALSVAGKAVLHSGLTRKHVLVITDGMNTIGPDPASILPQLQQEARSTGGALSVHFVAFDVNARVFAGVKKLGATVVGAADEAQLNTQLEFILAKKILLEDEEPQTK